MSSPQALFSVAGKNVLVTGGSRGIGLMIASTFFRHGANVLLTSRDPKACQEAADSLIGSGSSSNSGDVAPNNKVHHVASNVSTREGCKALAQHTSDIFNGKLDVLVNNAGASWGEDPAYDIGSRESGRMNWGWDKVMDLNVKGMFYLTRECVPMLQRVHDDDNKTKNSSTQRDTTTASFSDPGRIINIGSVTGFIPQNAPTHAYEVSKAAVHHLTKKLASDLAPRGITVNAIAPGYCLTRMSSGLGTWLPKLDDKTEAQQVIADTIPLRRMGNDDDMGGAAVYLSSRAGSWITGHILTVDGGSVGCIQIPLSNL
jgi:NAD(P)-dependent dehydrogenase (short-subunit alcohol dehydrogenase family)